MEKKNRKMSFHCVLLLITCLGSEGLNWVGGRGVTESVKDSRPASFLKTLPPQSGLLLCIMSIRGGAERR